MPLVEKFLKKDPETVYYVNDIVDKLKEKRIPYIEEWRQQIAHGLAKYSLEKENNIVRIRSMASRYKYSESCAKYIRNKFIERKGMCFEGDCTSSHCPKIH